MKTTALLLFAFLIGLAGCRSRNTSSTFDALASTTRTDASWKTTRPQPSDANATLLRSAVRIRCDVQEGGRTITGHGTAFGVDLSQFGYAGRRCLLTAAHNVLGDDKKPCGVLSIEIVDDAGTRWSRCRPVAWDPGLDLCIVESDEDLPGLLRLADGDVPIGGRLILAGSPRGVPVELFTGTLEKKFEGGTVCFRANVPFDHGDSGGPVVDAANGRVIGVAVAGVPKDGDLDHNTGLFVPTVGIVTFLDSHRRGKPLPAPRSSPIATETVASPRAHASTLVKTAPARARVVRAPAPVPASTASPGASKRSLTDAEKILAEFD